VIFFWQIAEAPDLPGSGAFFVVRIVTVQEGDSADFRTHLKSYFGLIERYFETGLRSGGHPHCLKATVASDRVMPVTTR